MRAVLHNAEHLAAMNFFNDKHPEHDVMWIGLEVLPAFVGQKCENITCNGKLKWDDGTLFSFEPNLHPIRLNNISQCMIFTSKELTDLECNRNRKVLCQINCNGGQIQIKDE